MDGKLVAEVLKDTLLFRTPKETLEEYEEFANSIHKHRATHKIEYLGKLEACTECGMVRHYEYAELFNPNNPACFRVINGGIVEYDDWDECPGTVLRESVQKHTN